MEGIQFDDEGGFSRTVNVQKKKSLTSLVQKLGIAKTERQAQYVLLGTTVAAILVTIFVLSIMGGSSQPLPWQAPPASDIPAGLIQSS